MISRASSVSPRPEAKLAKGLRERGAKTRTWFTLPPEDYGQDVFAVAGLRREDWGDWLDGPPDAAGLLCRPYPELMVVERTAESWVRR